MRRVCRVCASKECERFSGIMTSAYYLGMVNSVLTGVITAVMEFAIFAVVSAITYLRDKPFCDDLNNAPEEYAKHP